MVAQALNIPELRLQLEATAAQLRLLSLLPESQRDVFMNKAIDGTKAQVSRIDARLKKLFSETQSLRSKTENRLRSLEAGQYIHKRHTMEKQVKSQYDGLWTLRNGNTNKDIIGPPASADDFFCLDESGCDRIIEELGWDLNDGDSLRDRQDFLPHIIRLGGDVDWFWQRKTCSVRPIGLLGAHSFEA